MSVAKTAERRTRKTPSGLGLNEATVRGKGPRIDPEFASLIPALAADEFANLEALIRAEGCLDPLIVWEEENILLDGHNRKRICNKHGLPYNISYRSFPSRDSARDFILHQQLGRRNISVDAAGYLRGKRYLETRRQGQRTDLTSGHNDPKRLSERLAEEYKVGEKTIRRDARFASAVDGIAANCGPEARVWLLSRDMTLARSGVIRLSKLTPQAQGEYIEELLDGEGRPHFPSTRKTITLSRKPEELVPRLFRVLGMEDAAVVARLLTRLLKTSTPEKNSGGRSRRRTRT